MNIQKLATAVAVTAAISGGAGTASAAITGVPGEASLVPMVLHNPGDGPAIETYVGLYVPTTIGQDTIINTYTAPNAAPTPTVQQLDVAEIHWTLFDENSVKVENGTCEVSPGDFVLWTTDENVQDVQVDQREELLDQGILGLPNGVPDPVCGPRNPKRFGYVVFQTIPGADGQAADFAFWGAASIVGFGPGNGHVGIPVMPMADGADPLPSGSGTPALFNEVIAGGVYGDSQPSDPVKYAPILAGIRMNNANGAPTEKVRVQAPIQGPAANLRSLHVWWFDRNQEDRVASVLIWDDHEGVCSDAIPLPRELNLWMYNHEVEVEGFPAGPPNWLNLGNNVVMNELTSVIDAVQPPLLTGYQSRPYCTPEYWYLDNLDDLQSGEEALGGYVEYELDEIGEPAAVNVNSAAVSFNLQEYFTGWASHMSTDLGKF